MVIDDALAVRERALKKATTKNSSGIKRLNTLSTPQLVSLERVVLKLKVMAEFT